MKTTFLSLTFLILCMSSELFAGPAATVARQVDDVLRLLWRQSPEAVSRATREMDERIVRTALERHGPEAVRAFETGGFALLRVARTYGDEPVSLAVRNVEASRFIAASPDTALQLARQYGDDAVLLESRVPGLLTRQAGQLSGNEIRLMSELPLARQKKVGSLVMRSESPEVARRLVQEHARHGDSLLTRIPMHYKIGGAVLTGAVLERAIRGDDGLTARFLERGREAFFWVIKSVAIAFAGLFALKYALVYALGKLFSWPSGEEPSGSKAPE